MPKQDPYEILGVSRTAAQDEIKRAYRRLARQHHPDRNPGDKAAEQRFKEISAAYEVVGDPKRRAEFDRFGAGGPVPDFASWGRAGNGQSDPGVAVDFGSMGDLSSIFEQFFGGGRRGGGVRTAKRRPAARGADLETNVSITLEEAAHGTARQVRLSAPGSAGATETIEFRIPAGVADGQRIRIAGRGNEGPGGRGDLYVRCAVLPHRYFRRDGDDILLDLPVTFTEAALGARIEIPTLDGPTTLTVPPGTSSGVKLRLRERGVASAKRGRRGDLFAVVKIVAPRALSAEAEELLRGLAREAPADPRAGLGWPG